MFDFLLLLTLISTITNCSNINFQSTMKKKNMAYYNKNLLNKKTYTDIKNELREFSTSRDIETWGA